MKKKKKFTIIISSILVGIIVTYFASCFIGYGVMANILFKKRTCDVEILNTDPYYTIINSRDDYPNLTNREEIVFPYKEYNLMGYLYQTEIERKGLIISAHGMNSLADGEHAQYQSYYLDKGWDIFAFDMVGCGRSEGKGILSLAESRFCVESAIEAMKEKYEDVPICLIGHSWGGYGVVAATNNYHVNCVIEFSGFNEPRDLMLGMANKTTPLASLTAFGFDLALQAFEGNKAYYKASEAVINNPDINYYLIHGENDDVVPIKNYSIYGQFADENYQNVKTLMLADSGHIGLWRSKEANEYFYDKYREIESLMKTYGSDLPSPLYDDFKASVDKDKASQLNFELLDDIEEYLLSSIKI